ncbi:MAG TPA: pilus assembly protein [Microvirga sp.]|jgi:hypothetical protein
MTKRISTILRSASLLALAASLAGCNGYSRRETISYQAGDAVAWNRAVHTIDPWPAASNDTSIPVSGRRVARAIETYETGGAAGTAAPQPLALVPVAPMVPGAGVPLK